MALFIIVNVAIVAVLGLVAKFFSK